MIYVLDTTAFSALMRNEPEIISFMRQHPPGEIAAVQPVIAEIEYGIRRIDSGTKKHALLTNQRDRLLEVIQVLPWDRPASVHFGRIKTDLEQAGTPIDDFDIAIGAIALSHGAEVITANIAHFSRIKTLKCRHWK
jgi:tRNA(fMet)-specific endonuclease VapC